jgi:hypothetical protein
MQLYNLGNYIGVGTKIKLNRHKKAPDYGGLIIKAISFDYNSS